MQESFRNKAYCNMSVKEHIILRDEQFEVLSHYATNHKMDTFDRLNSIRTSAILIALHEEFVRGIR